MNEAGLRAQAAQWLTARRPAVLVQVRDSRGSVPREAGTRMLVAAEEVIGTIGGGHLEWQAIARAREMLAAGNAANQEQKVALGPTLGQCCGGALTLAYSPWSAEALAAWVGPAPRFHLQLYGAGHVGRAIVALLAGIDCRVEWIDERESEFPPAGGEPPHIQHLCVEPVEAEVPNAPPAAFFLILTHSHELDQRITEAVLKRGDFGFCGLIGSKTKRARFEHRMHERGIPTAVLERLTCPIGVPGITGKEPEVLAVAVVAQLLQASARAPDASLR
jgi:xanthine dehydrogenase accessory factor